MRIKVLFPFSCLAIAALLSGCSQGSLSSNSSVQSEASSSTTNESTSIIESSSSETIISSSEESSSSIESSVPEGYGEFSVTRIKNGSEPVFDDATSSWHLYVTSSKAEYSLTGYFEGDIVIEDGNALVSGYKGATLDLSGLYLVGTIQYTLADKNVALVVEEGTTNYICGKTTALVSENNVEISGAGSLIISASTGHGIDCDKVTLYGDTLITINNVTKDGIHAHNLLTLNDSSVPFSGTLSIINVGDQGIDCSDGDGSEADPYSGSISIVNGAKITISNAVNMVKTDISLSVEGSLVGQEISGDAITTKNTGNCVVSVGESATLTCNGTNILSTTL